VTDPRNFELVGVPPADLLQEVVAAWQRAGLDAVEIRRRSTEITREFVYDPAPEDIRDRIKPRFVSTKLIPVRNRTLAEILNPQPRCSEVLKELLTWIDRVDFASQEGASRPPCQRPDGSLIFPEEGSENDLWWLTEIAKRKQPEEEEKQLEGGDEDGPPSSDEAGEKEDAEETDDDDADTSSSHSEDRGKVALPEQGYTGYFEKQREARCAIHVRPLALLSKSSLACDVCARRPLLCRKR